MAEISDLDPADGATNARWPEGMAPSAINNSARALEGMLARWFRDSNGTIVTGGSSTAYTVTTNRTISSYYDGLAIGFEAHATCAALAPTLDVNGIGAITLVGPGGASLYGGALTSGSKYVAVYNADATKFEVINPTKKFRGSRVYNVSAQSIPNNALTLVSWDAEDFDTDATHDPITNNSRITIPSGVEFVNVSLIGSWENSVAGFTRYAVITKNGVIAAANRSPPSTGIAEFTMATGPVSVSGGDYFDVSVFQDSGADLGFGGGGTAFFSMGVLG